MQTAETVETTPKATAEQALEPAPQRAEATPTREAKEPARPAPHTDAPSTPAIGRIVHTNLRTSTYPCPAVITRVHGPGLVNLRLLPDGQDLHCDSDLTPTSVSRYEGPLDALNGLPREFVGVRWWWPPRA